MTISIQGSWGTGKTSTMQIVNKALLTSGTTQCIWFNTWQFSQFNMDNELAVSLLTCLLEELSISGSQKETVSKTTQIIRLAQNAGRFGKEVALSFLDATVGGRVAENVEKGRSFFDKIIQVPFKMPVAEYNISNYVCNCFCDIGIVCTDADLHDYEELIKLSIGTNPRSMKRLFNAYLLLTIVVSQEVLENDRTKQLLFVNHCRQLKRKFLCHKDYANE